MTRQASHEPARTTEAPGNGRKGLLQHSPFVLGFFLAAGALLAHWLFGLVLAVSPVLILIIVALTGEGATSQRSFRYRLLGEGDRLFEVRNGLERARCPTA